MWIMKRKFKTLFVVAAAFAVSYQAYGEMKKNESSELVLANVEALAAGEGVGITCSQSCRDGIGLCWTEDSSDPMYCERSANPSNRCSCLR